MKTTINRRSFLKTTAFAVGAPMILPASVFGANNKINIAWVGVGGMGFSDLRSCANGNNIVALCDCDTRKWAKAKRLFPEAACYSDFRTMLAEMGDQIDAVGIGTPDHTHFAVAYMAISMGKHVFCEKPLVHSIWEARTLNELAAKKGVVTQMGNQGHAFEGAALTKEWYEAGLVGDVRKVITWTDRPAKGFGFSGAGHKEYLPQQPVPEQLDWDLWLGPASETIGFNSKYHPAHWRGWWDFGCGGLGDIGCHTIDTAYWAMDLGHPASVEVEMKEEVNPIYTPKGSVVTFKFPGIDKRGPVDLVWYEGPSRPEMPEGFDWDQNWDARDLGGLIMVGEEGGICHDGMRPRSPKLYPQENWNDYRAKPERRVPKTLPRTRSIHEDWLTAIREGTKSCSDFSYSAPLTEVILLGTLAIRTGKNLSWDADRMKITGNEEANSLIQTEAREGWRTQDLV